MKFGEKNIQVIHLTGKLTRKEKEVLAKIKDMGEITVNQLAEMNDTSYTAARLILESLVVKTVLGEEWARKGNKKKYIIK